MFLTPLNYSFALHLVPVFEWKPVEPADRADADAAPPCPDSPAPPADMRLVLRGYEWRNVAQRAVFPREDWESILRSEADAKEQERDPVAHRNEAARRPLRPQPAPNDAQKGPDWEQPQLGGTAMARPSDTR